MGDGWTWRRSEQERLAQFVLPDSFVGHSLIRLNGREQKSETAFEMAACLYDNFRRQGFGYTKALSPNGGKGSEEQYILRPHQLLAGNRAGDCVSLSLFFAGMCAAVELRPHLVLMSYPGKAEGHVMVLLPKYVGTNTMDVRILVPRFPQEEVAAGLLRLIDEEKALAVDLELGTETRGRQVFSAAHQRGRANIENAAEVHVLDVLDVHQDLPPRGVARLPEVAEPNDAPPSPTLGQAVRDDFAERLGADPERWDRPSIEAVRTTPGTTAHDTRKALLDAVDALPAFEAVGGRRPALARLQTIYYRTVHREPRTSSAESLLVEAAAAETGREGTLSPLVRFVLGVAAEDRPRNIAPLTRWLESNSAQLENAENYRRKLSEPVHWALIDLGPDDPSGELDWADRSVTVQIEPPIPGVGPRPYGSPEELKTSLRELMGDLWRSLPTEARLLVDIIAPRAMLDIGIEHWNLLGDEWGKASLHSEGLGPRFRWTMHFHDPNLQRRVRKMAEAADWTLPPSRMTPADAADDQATDKWLARSDVKAAPALIGAAHGGGGDPLIRMLGTGHGFILWFPSEEHGSELLEQWGDPNGEPQHLIDTLPERVLDGLPEKKVPVLIWNDIKGRDRFELYEGRPQSPSGGNG